jgi:hypothetical protein
MCTSRRPAAFLLTSTGPDRRPERVISRIRREAVAYSQRVERFRKRTDCDQSTITTKPMTLTIHLIFRYPVLFGATVESWQFALYPFHWIRSIRSSSLLPTSPFRGRRVMRVPRLKNKLYRVCLSELSWNSVYSTVARNHCQLSSASHARPYAVVGHVLLCNATSASSRLVVAGHTRASPKVASLTRRRNGGLLRAPSAPPHLALIGGLFGSGRGQ